MSQISGGYGWWQASDGLWYPPETHPDYRPILPPPPNNVASDALPDLGYGYVVKPVKANNGLAIASMVCGILGFLCLLPSFAAIPMGVIALRKIKERDEQGQGFAIAGIVLGCIAMLLLVPAVVVFVLGSQPSNPSG